MERLDRSILLKMSLPARSGFWIRQVRFAQNFDARFVIPQCHNRWILATSGQARVEQFDNHINIWQDLRHLTNCLVHVTWIPVNRHNSRQLYSRKEATILTASRAMVSDVNTITYAMPIHIRTCWILLVTNKNYSAYLTPITKALLVCLPFIRLDTTRQKRPSCRTRLSDSLIISAASSINSIV